MHDVPVNQHPRLDGECTVRDDSLVRHQRIATKRIAQLLSEVVRNRGESVPADPALTFNINDWLMVIRCVPFGLPLARTLSKAAYVRSTNRYATTAWPAS
jgi:hypothetical protein